MFYFIAAVHQLCIVIVLNWNSFVYFLCLRRQLSPEGTLFYCFKFVRTYVRACVRPSVVAY